MSRFYGSLCIWIVSHLSATNYRNWWKFDEVLTKTNLLSFFWDTVYTVLVFTLSITAMLLLTDLTSAPDDRYQILPKISENVSPIFAPILKKCRRRYQCDINKPNDLVKVIMSCKPGEE